MLPDNIKEILDNEQRDITVIEEALLKAGFNKRDFMGRVISFTRKDYKGHITISIFTVTNCVNFIVRPDDPDLDDIDIYIGLHLFCRLFEESKDLNQFLNILKRL